MTSKKTCALVLGCCFLLAVSTAASAAKLEKVLPFTGTDHVRVRLVISAGESKSSVDVTGQIVPATGDDKKPLWEGTLGKAKLNADGSAETDLTVKGLKPKLWSPGAPNLYNLVINVQQNGKTLDTKTTRFGFRTFEVKGASIRLNGKPIFLRGIAINPPGRGVPTDVGTSRKFAEDYVRFMRAHNVNIIRLEPESNVWFDVCDELGMMVYQGFYGAPPGDRKNPKAEGKNEVPELNSSIAAYRKVFDNYVAHPAIVIYVLSNELPYMGKRGDEWHTFLTKAHGILKKEYTVPFIGNAGYGQGREGDINDVHRYWGWYYNSHLTYFNLRDPLLFGDPAKTKNQPLTFSECVGAFTGPSGAFNLIFRKQLGAQLGWTGHAEDQVGEAQKYQAFIFKHAAESFRTMRETNPRLSGLMPFTILFRNWVGIDSFEQMGHNANADQMAISYNPVLLSFEQWTPNVYAGTTVKGFVHVVNDADDFSDLTGATIEYALNDPSDKAIHTDKLNVPAVKYYGTHKLPLELKLPADLKTGTYRVAGKVMAGGKEVAHNSFDLYVAAAKPEAVALAQPISLYDPAGKTAEALKRLGISFAKADLKRLKDAKVVVIGEAAWDAALTSASKDLKSAVEAGTRVLVLSQPHEKFDATWLPTALEFPKTSNNDPTYEKRQRPMRDGMHVNPERPWHPVLAGIERDQLKWWSDYTGWDQTKPGFPDIYPVSNGFRLTKAADLAHTAIIANYDRGLEAIAVAEMFDGKGSVLMTSFNLVPRVGLDPVADRVLMNLARYVASTETREVQPLIESPIVWGNYPTERGVAIEPITGLVVNCRWQTPPTAPNATPLPDNEGAWNTRPGDGFLPHGRRVFGPWTYTNATGIRDLSDPKQAATVAGNPAPELDDVDNTADKSKKAGASPTGNAEIHLRVPAGRKWAVTKVENPSKTPGKIEMQVNGGKAGTIEIAPGQSGVVKAPIDGDATDLAIKFTADKALVLIETSFE